MSAKKKVQTHPRRKSSAPVYANQLKGKELTEPDQAWVAAITYGALPKSFVYLAAIVDAYSRKWVGWKVAKRIAGPVL